MKKLLPTLAIVCMLGSCASLFDRASTRFFVNAPAGTRITYRNENGTLDTATPNFRNDARVVAWGNNWDTFPVTLKSDSNERTIHIRPRRKNYYIPPLGTNLQFDSNFDPRFGYPYRVYADMNPKSKKGYSFRKPYKKGNITWIVSPVLTNVFVFNLNNLNPAGSPFGIASGINYHYSDNQFLSVEIGVATVGRKEALYIRTKDSLLPQKAYEQKTGSYLNVRHHHTFGRLDCGYGIATGFRFGKKFYGKYMMATYPVDSVIYRSRVFSFGGSFAANCRITNTMYAGINYQPQLFSVDRDMKFNYEHLLTFGVSWRISIPKD